MLENSQGMDANGMQFGRDGRGAGGLPFSVRMLEEIYIFEVHYAFCRQQDS